MTWQKPLTDLSLRVFETMCFAVPNDDTDVERTEATSGYSVAFKSQNPDASPVAEGVLWLGMEDDCAAEMVSNMLADPCPAPADLRDGVAELANVIVGQLFLLHAPNSGHHLGTPVQTPRPPDEMTLVEVNLPFDVGVATVILAAT